MDVKVSFDKSTINLHFSLLYSHKIRTNNYHRSFVEDQEGVQGWNSRYYAFNL